MELTHRLTYNNTSTVIDEPIGFDDLKMTMKRHDYHGMGAEMSLGNLEFYGQAFSIIAAAYEADIDSEVLYEVYADSTLIYSGKIDLSTYSVKQADYQSVSVKVGEIGVKTVMNNNLSLDIDLNNPKTIDGSAVEKPNWLNLRIPIKHLLYTNRTDFINKTSNGWHSIYRPTIPAGGVDELGELNNTYNLLVVPIGDSDICEFGNTTFSQGMPFDDQLAYVQRYPDNIQNMYEPDTEHVTLYGQGTSAFIDINIRAKFSAFQREYVIEEPDDRYLTYKLILREGNTIIHESPSKMIFWRDLLGGGVYHDMSFSGVYQCSANEEIRIYIQFYFSRSDDHVELRMIEVHEDSYVKMTMYDNLPEVVAKANMISVHDALNVISHAITENLISVRSDWYRDTRSKWEAGDIGGGALKAITNGYKIRGLYEGVSGRNMPVSFKSMIEALDALDCIGWGYSTEDGTMCVRVERWDWFYKSDIILTLTNVKEVQIAVDTDCIPTELKIGYKKFATNEQYNSIESPHGSRVFKNGIKATNRTLTRECEFIADNYAIEETRRARNTSEEFTYDENIFVLELTKDGDTYAIGHTATNAVNVGQAGEFINAKLTPRHMAARWRDYLFSTNNTTPFRFISGEINYKASFGVIPEHVEGETLYSLKPFSTSEIQSEDDDINYISTKFKAEKITFSYPLSVAQYQAVKANPYGLVSVNGMLGWILDFKYSFDDGMADFTLLAAYNNQLNNSML